jgi:hypothetical protein
VQLASELVIRPGRNDTGVVADLLAPGGAVIYLPNGRPVIDRLVVDAHLAPGRPEFAAAAHQAGVPVVVDPLTHLWQGELRGEDEWANLPFGQAAPLRPDDFATSAALDRAVAAVVEFQLEHRATAIVPPYVYVSSPTDAWFERALELMRATGRYMSSNRISLPVIPLLCGSLQLFAAPAAWPVGLDRFALTALDLGPQAFGLCVSPITASDSYSKVQLLFGAFEHLRGGFGRPVLAWRQGFYGPGLVAAGAAGYETGIATGEFCNVPASIRSRRPRDKGKGGGGSGPGIYVDPLGRTLPSGMGVELLGHQQFRAKIVCNDVRCCPHGAQSTIQHRRPHAIRTRARALAALDALPHRTWRLHQIAKGARAAVTLATQANRILDGGNSDRSIATRGMESLAQIAQHLRTADLEDADAA